MAHEHDDEHDHRHGTLTFQKADATDDAIGAIRVLHPALADVLLLSRRFSDLGADEKAELERLQKAVELHPEWAPGYHAPGDMCATCGTPTHVLWDDVFEEGRLPYGAFIGDVPVHAKRECIDGFARVAPRRAPQIMDKLRRANAKDLDRPTAHMTQFFRHDVLAHPPFGLEDWANSVADANGGRLDRQTMRDIDRLIAWVHARLYH